MTIQEAIEKIKRVKGLYAYESDYEAFDMAIRSLELWKELEPDTDYDDGDFWAYSKRQIDDSIAEIEGDRP